ncbi:MAG: hypothetical protein E7576_06320 [Ruminococcaceae bacterium]|jgi:hypothetical protein|nr:hypothetical protein [Oscillospiraceae bacterium]
MAEEEKKRNEAEERTQEEAHEAESNAARRLRLTGGEGEDPIHEGEAAEGSFFSNFWYHHKWKVIIGAAFAFILITGISQYAAHSDPDITMLYAGTKYITATQNQKLTDIFETMTEDRNGDGKTYVQLNDVVFYTEDQLAEYTAWCQENGEDMTVDRLANKQANDRYVQQVWADPLICIFSESQYSEVARSGGFVKLADLFADDPDSLENLGDAAADEYGVRFWETKFCKFYDAAQIFPRDALIAVRTVPTMSALTGRKKAEEAQAANAEMFRRILTFEYPEGYDPEKQEQQAEAVSPDP